MPGVYHIFGAFWILRWQDTWLLIFKFPSSLFLIEKTGDIGCGNFLLFEVINSIGTVEALYCL